MAHEAHAGPEGRSCVSGGKTAPIALLQRGFRRDEELAETAREGVRCPSVLTDRPFMFLLLTRFETENMGFFDEVLTTRAAYRYASTGFSDARLCTVEDVLGTLLLELSTLGLITTSSLPTYETQDR